MIMKKENLIVIVNRVHNLTKTFQNLTFTIRKTSLQKSETKMQPARLKRAPASRMLFSAPACEARRRPAPLPPRSGLIVDLRDQAGRPESESDR